MALQPNPDQPIDRTSQPPFLLRLFYRDAQFHSPSEFTAVPPTQSLLSSSLQIYTWPDTTISELTSLFLSALPDALPSPAAGTRLGFRLLFPDTRSVTGPGAGDRGRWLSKELGSVVVGDDVPDVDGDGGMNGAGGPVKLNGDADKSLADARFVIGDYISCAILPPRPDGSVAPLPLSERSSGGEGGRGGRDRGFGGRGGFGGRTENGYGDAYGRGGYGGGGRFERGGYDGDRYGSSVPSGDWRRGERVPEGPGYGRGRGRGRGGYY